MDATNERRCTIALKSIAKSLERIATAMEKGNAPSGEGQELFERFKGEMQKEVERRSEPKRYS